MISFMATHEAAGRSDLTPELVATLLQAASGGCRYGSHAVDLHVRGLVYPLYSNLYLITDEGLVILEAVRPDRREGSDAV